MQADLTLVAAADGCRQSGSLKNVGKASLPAFLNALSDCAGHSPAFSSTAAVRTGSAPPRVLSREDAPSDSGNFAGESAGSDRTHPEAATSEKPQGNTAGVAVLSSVAQSSGGGPTPPDATGDLRDPAEAASGCDATDPHLDDPPAKSATNFSGTVQLFTGENGVTGAALESTMPAADPLDGQRAASAVEAPGTDLPPNGPAHPLAAARDGDPTAPATDTPPPGNNLEGLASVPAGSDGGTAEGTTNAASGVRPETSSGGLQVPNSKPPVESPVEEGDAAARPVPGVSAAQSPATDSETSGGDAGDETADRPASLSADPPPAADKPLFASVDQRAFVEILENAGHTKASQALPPSVPTGLVKQLAERAALSIKEGTSEIRIALKPEALGHLQMEIATENQQVAVKVIVGTHLVKALLDQNLTQLKHLLQEQGLLLDKFDVLVAQDSSHFGSGRQSAGNAQAQRKDRNNGDPETDAGTRQEHETAPRRQREGNARIDYFA